LATSRRPSAISARSTPRSLSATPALTLERSHAERYQPRIPVQRRRVCVPVRTRAPLARLAKVPLRTCTLGRSPNPHYGRRPTGLRPGCAAPNNVIPRGTDDHAIPC
jgi:hypothetical protein